MVRLGYFPNSSAVTENQTHISSVVPLLSDLSPGCFTDWATAAGASSRYSNALLVLWVLLLLILYSSFKSSFAGSLCYVLSVHSHQFRIVLDAAGQVGEVEAELGGALGDALLHDEVDQIESATHLTENGVLQKKVAWKQRTINFLSGPLQFVSLSLSLSFAHTHTHAHFHLPPFLSLFLSCFKSYHDIPFKKLWYIL